MIEIKQLSEQQAQALNASKWWRSANAHSIAAFQVAQQNPCCPLRVYQYAMSSVLGRQVLMVELQNPAELIKEMNGEKPSPTTIIDTIDQIPDDVRKIVIL